jgi:hypothetical protein
MGEVKVQEVKKNGKNGKNGKKKGRARKGKGGGGENKKKGGIGNNTSVVSFERRGIQFTNGQMKVGTLEGLASRSGLSSREWDEDKSRRTFLHCKVAVGRYVEESAHIHIYAYTHTCTYGFAVYTILNMCGAIHSPLHLH